MDRPDAWHPDLVAGALSEVLQLVARPVSNTLGDLDPYVGCPVEKLFPKPTRTPPVRLGVRWRLPGMVSEDIEFDSLHVPLEPKFRRRYREEYRENHRVSARRIRPTDTSPAQRVLYLHGYMQPETYIEEVALLATMARRLDAEIIQMQFPYHGRRTPRGARFSGEFYWTADLVRSVEALRQTVLDARTLLRILLAQDDRPVGISGLSLGGALTLCLTCLEERFAFSMPLIAHMDLTALVADAPVLRKMRRDLRAFGWGRKEFGAFVSSLGWNDLRPKLDPERIFLIAAAADLFFDPRLVEFMHRRWGEPRISWYPSSHMGFLRQLPQVLTEMRRFMKSQSACSARCGAAPGRR